MAGGSIRTCILSHGRSGTLYTARLLQAVGLDFGHERDGKDGTVGGTFFSGTRDLNSYKQIFHQVRNPLDVISSATTCKHRSFVKTFSDIGLGRIDETDPLRRAMLSWLHYTKWAELRSIWRYRVEDMPAVWPELLFRLDVKKTDLPDIPVNTNHRRHKNYSWNDLSAADSKLAEAIYDSARRYGYEK